VTILVIQYKALQKVINSDLWVICQIGAREHYYVPRSLSSVGRRICLYTDYWASKNEIILIPKKLKQRYHEEIDSKHVISFNKKYLLLELFSHLFLLQGWELTQSRNEWFAKNISRHLEDNIGRMAKPPIVFAYSYAAREIFTIAKSLGCPTILGQIDPGPVEMQLVAELHEKAGIPLNDKPNEAYWTSWRHECELADVIMVNSHWSLSALEQVGINPNKIKVVPLVYETQQKIKNVPDKSLVFSEERPLEILFLGQVILRKGILEITEAIKTMVGKSVHWTIVGPGDSWLLNLLRDLPQTTVTGIISRDEVGKYYNDADVFILPTHSDGYAITQLEAAAFGLPIIASENCGNVVHHEVDGLILPKVSTEAIVDAVTQLIDQPEKVTAYGVNMRKRKHNTLQELANNLDKIEKSIIS